MPIHFKVFDIEFPAGRATLDNGLFGKPTRSSPMIKSKLFSISSDKK